LSTVQPLLCIPVGVVVERRHAKSKWLDFTWRPVGIFNGSSDVEPWTILSSSAEMTLFYAGAAEIELHRSETSNYVRNLASGAPSVWVVLHPSGGDPPYRLATVTADPAEGEGLTEAGTAIIETVPMPASIREAIAAFVAEHHIEQVFEKRVRDRADPEAMARHNTGHRQDDE
jgi:hypothetical protein